MPAPPKEALTNLFRKKNGVWNFSGTDYLAFWWHYLLYFVPCVQMLVVWMSFAELGMAWMLMTWLVGFPGFSAVPMLMPCQVRVLLVPRISPLVRRAKKAKATSASCTRMQGEWINEFERQSLNRRNPSFLEPQLVKNVLAARDSPCINPLTY